MIGCMFESNEEEVQEIFDALIEKYRELVEKRYTYNVIQNIIPPNSDLNETTVAKIRSYFIEDVYPQPEVRVKLDKAFANLKTYMYKPSKMWRLMGNMTSAIFEFGRLFPKALKIGIKALKSYLDAKDFENCILESARELNLKLPISNEDFFLCMKKIPREQTEKLMNDVIAMFIALTNDQLVAKTIQILDKVILRMQDYPETYPDEDIAGIKQGISLLKNGYQIFSGFSDSLKKNIIEVMKTNERKFINDIYDFN